MTKMLHFYYTKGGFCEQESLRGIKKAEPKPRLIFSHVLNLLNFQRINNGFCISLRLLLIVSRQGDLHGQQMAVDFA